MTALYLIALKCTLTCSWPKYLLILLLHRYTYIYLHIHNCNVRKLCDYAYIFMRSFTVGVCIYGLYGYNYGCLDWTGIKRITDRMIYKAATACADMLTEAEKAEGRTFPTIQNIREVSLNVACAVIKEGLEKDLCTKISHDHVRREGLQNYVRRKMYYPEYVPLL